MGSKWLSAAEAFCIGHDAPIIIRKETWFHVILEETASTDTTGSAGTGRPLGKPGNIRAVLGGRAFNRKSFLGAQGGLADPILKGTHEADNDGVQDQGDREPGDRHFCGCSQNTKGSRTHKGQGDQNGKIDHYDNRSSDQVNGAKFNGPGGYC